jgi:hypothetical protein
MGYGAALLAVGAVSFVFSPYVDGSNTVAALRDMLASYSPSPVLESALSHASDAARVVGATLSFAGLTHLIRSASCYANVFDINSDVTAKLSKKQR